MGSAFDAVFKRCAKPAHFSFNGEVIGYTPRGGDLASITAVVRWREGVGEVNREDGRIYRVEAELDIDLLECPSLAAGDKFTIDGADYRLDRMPTRTRNTATIVVILIEQRDKGRRERFLPTGG